MVTQASSVMMSSPSPTNWAQDLHENLICIRDTAFPGLSIGIGKLCLTFALLCYAQHCK